MSHPVGYFTGYNPQTQKPDTLHLIQERFGSQLEKMSYEQKIVFRGALVQLERRMATSKVGS
jgi:hypothetical protein